MFFSKPLILIWRFIAPFACTWCGGISFLKQLPFRVAHTFVSFYTSRTHVPHPCPTLFTWTMPHEVYHIALPATSAISRSPYPPIYLHRLPP